MEKEFVARKGFSEPVAQMLSKVFLFWNGTLVGRVSVYCNPKGAVFVRYSETHGIPRLELVTYIKENINQLDKPKIKEIFIRKTSEMRYEMYTC